MSKNSLLIEPGRGLFAGQAYKAGDILWITKIPTHKDDPATTDRFVLATRKVKTESETNAKIRKWGSVAPITGVVATRDIFDGEEIALHATDILSDY